MASSGFVLQVAAIANDLHQLLLNCVADTHALLALKAFQPSRRAPTPKVAQIARADHRQAKAASRVTRAAAQCPGDKIVGPAALGAAEGSVTLQDRGDNLLALILDLAAWVQRNTTGAFGHRLCTICSCDAVAALADACITRLFLYAVLLGLDRVTAAVDQVCADCSVTQMHHDQCA